MGSRNTARQFLKSVWELQPGYNSKITHYGALPYKDWRGGGKEGAWSTPEPFVPVGANFKIPTLADLYFCPFLFTGKRRSAENSTDTRWLYADLDHIDPRDLPWELQPTLAWESSADRFQALWLTNRPLNGELFAVLNDALCTVTKADKGTWGERRVLRVPGSVSYKRDRPWEVRMLRGYSKILYTHNVEELIASLGPYMRASRPSSQQQTLPEDLPTPERAKRIARAKLPPSVLRTLRIGPQPGDDRSRILWKLYHQMMDNEIGPKTTFVIIKNSKWNKFRSRHNGDGVLWNDVRQARMARQAAEGRNQERSAKRNGNSGGNLRINTMNMALANPVQWAWRGRWVLGGFNLLVGAEGVGKGTLTAWMLSQWSQGRLAGHLYGQPVGVGVIGDEDSWNDTWTPRLYVAGADEQHIFQIDKPKGGYISMAEDKEELVELIEHHGIRVLYLDALLDNLGAKVDDWKAKEVRDALEPIRWLARTMNVCVIGSLHPNKKEATSFRQLLSGSHAFNAVPRSSMFLANHPTSQDETHKVLVRGKGNLGPLPPAVELHVYGKKFIHSGKKFNESIIDDVKQGEPLTADDVLQSRITPAKTDLQVLLEDILSQANGKGVPSSEVYSQVEKQMEVSRRAVRYAAERLGIETGKNWKSRKRP